MAGWTVRKYLLDCLLDEIMPPNALRRDFLRLSGATAILGIAGCIGDSAGGTGSSDTPEVTTTEARSSTSEQPTTSTLEISEKEAEERALSAEEEYITNRFENASCVNEWGLNSYTGFEKDAKVTNRTTDGFEVAVSHPYWWSNNQTDADGGSKSRYLITAETTKRISGDEVSPC